MAGKQSAKKRRILWLFSGQVSLEIDRSPHVRESKTLLDSGFHAVDSGFHLLDSRSFSVELGFRIRIVSGIPDSYTCIPDSKAQDSGFHKQKFPRFRIPNAKISRIPESGFLYMGRDRFCADQTNVLSVFLTEFIICSFNDSNNNTLQN